MLMRTKLALARKLNSTRKSIYWQIDFFSAATHRKKKTFFIILLVTALTGDRISNLHTRFSLHLLLHDQWSFSVQPIHFLPKKCFFTMSFFAHTNSLALNFCLVNAIVFLFCHLTIWTLFIAHNSYFTIIFIVGWLQPETLNIIFPSKCLASIVFRLTRYGIAPMGWRKAHFFRPINGVWSKCAKL